jgi:hypothetical protein
VNGEVWKKVVQKKKEEDLTGPTLLEISGYATVRPVRRLSDSVEGLQITSEKWSLSKRMRFLH